jgi:translation elongation factor P/translation initiation factor 5A
MKKQAKDIKKGDKITLGGKECIVETFEISDIGKHGKRKCKIEANTPEGEKVVIIRPEDYPVDVI